MAAPKRFRVRLEAQDGSGHYRETVLTASSKQQAQERCEQREREICAFKLSADELERIEQIAAADTAAAEGTPALLRGQDKGRLFGHRQTEPYLVVSVEEEAKR